MTRHLTANLWLLLLTILLCSVAYPLVLLVIAQAPFLKDRAEGSLLRDADGNVIGSRLEVQSIGDDEYFWPRPSAASYDGRKSGASNLSANNPALRSQVENRLGAVLKYGPKSLKKGEMIRGDVEKWFVSQPGLLATWAEKNPDLAKGWVKDNEAIAKVVDAWSKSDEGKAWLKDKTAEELAKLKPEELAVDYLKFFSIRHPGSWPAFDEKTPAVLTPTDSCTEIQNFFYPMWREAHADVDLDPVPADMVTTSGSGLDPHITLKSARYQFDRVATAWAKKRGMSKDQVVPRLLNLLDAHKHAPLGGLAGVEMVNVTELNFALKNSEW